MIGDEASHPDHQVLVIALVEKKKVSRQSLVNILRHKAAVFLNKLDSRNKGAPLGAAGLLPTVSKLGLLRRETQLGRQIPVRNSGCLQPCRIVRTQGFVYRKPDQAGTILVRPARGRSLPDLLLNNAYKPRPKRCRLGLV